MFRGAAVRRKLYALYFASAARLIILDTSAVAEPGLNRRSERHTLIDVRHTRALKSKLKTLSIKVPRATSAKVARLAKERHQTVSAIVRDAIDAYPEGPQAGSFAERARRHLGVFAGPGDLSTNPKHLVGFGAWRR